MSNELGKVDVGKLYKKFKFRGNELTELMFDKHLWFWPNLFVADLLISENTIMLVGYT